MGYLLQFYVPKEERASRKKFLKNMKEFKFPEIRPYYSIELLKEK